MYKRRRPLMAMYFFQNTLLLTSYYKTVITEQNFSQPLLDLLHEITLHFVMIYLNTENIKLNALTLVYTITQNTFHYEM